MRQLLGPILFVSLLCGCADDDGQAEFSDASDMTRDELVVGDTYWVVGMNRQVSRERLVSKERQVIMSGENGEHIVSLWDILRTKPTTP